MNQELEERVVVENKVPMIVRKIPTLLQESDLEGVRYNILQKGEGILYKLGYRYPRVYFYVKGLDMNVWHEDLEKSLGTIDGWILNDPLCLMEFGIHLLKHIDGGYPLSIVNIDLLNNSVSHYPSKCRINAKSISFHPDKGSNCHLFDMHGENPNCFRVQCDLFDFATDIAGYYAARVRKSIEGFAKLDQMLREKQK